MRRRTRGHSSYWFPWTGQETRQTGNLLVARIAAMAAGGRARGAGTRRAATRRAFGAAGAGTGCAVAVGIAGTGHGGFYAEGFSGVARGAVRELREELARLINNQ